MTTVAVILAALVAVELAALAGRRTWVHWKLGYRQPLVEQAQRTLAGAIVSGVDPPRPESRAERRAFRLGALELVPMVSGRSRLALTELLERLGLVDDIATTLARSPRRFARRTAADELAELASARSSEVLAGGLYDRDMIVRLASVRGLASIPELTHLERMLEVLEQESDSAPSQVESAMYALAASSPGSLVRLMCSTTSQRTAWLAALALAPTGRADTIPILLSQAQSDNGLLSAVSVRAIGLVGGIEAGGALRNVLANPSSDPALRDQVERTLERITTGGARR